MELIHTLECKWQDRPWGKNAVQTRDRKQHNCCSTGSFHSLYVCLLSAIMFPTRCPSLVLLFSVAFCFVHAGPQFVAPPNATKATDQQQLITSYIPVLTVCPVGQDTSPHAVSTSQPPAALPSGWNTMHRRQPAPYYTNTSITAAAPSDSCSTSYSPRVTPFCGPQPTSCSPFVTFSTDHGYKLVTSRLRNQSATNLVPTIETLTTYYAASALALATGVPRGLVQQEVCSEGGCDDPQWESWAPFTVREVDIRNSTVQVSASVSRVSG